MQLRKQHGISLLAINRDKEVLREDVRNVPLRAGDMLVLHSIWQDLAQAASNRDFVVVTDYPKGEQRPHKFKIAMIDLRHHDAGGAVVADADVDRADDRRRRHADHRRAEDGRGLRGDQLEDGVPDGLPDPARLGDGQQRRGGLDRRTHPRPACRRASRSGCCELAIAILTTLFSLVISHVGATIVMVPMAINLALAANGNPTAFALIVALSASNNFMTASNPVMSMITGPANYTAKEMWRVGGAAGAGLHADRGGDGQPAVLSA